DLLAALPALGALPAILLLLLHALELAGQFLGFAPQHLLLPALVKIRYLLPALLFGELLLAAGQFPQLLQGLIQLAIALLGGGLLAGLVLVFLGVQLEVEHIREIPSHAAAATAALGRDLSDMFNLE